MYNRVINFGCSHAFGAEIAGSGIIHHPTNMELNFGNHVAKLYQKEFKIAARCGNSNRQIMVGADPVSYDVCYGECADCGQNAIRVRVDMSTYDDDGNGIGGEPGIDIHPDGMFMNGSFVDWCLFKCFCDPYIL